MANAIFRILTGIALLDPKVRAIAVIVEAVQSAISQITAWWIARQDASVQQKIIDAAALSARASTDEERYAAAQNWQTVLSSTRYIS